MTEHLDLKKTLTVCRASELSAAQIREVSKLSEMSVNAVEMKMRPSSSETVSNQPKAVVIRDCNSVVVTTSAAKRPVQRGVSSVLFAKR